MNKKRKYLLIDLISKLNGKEAVVAFRIIEPNLSFFVVSFYIIKKKGNESIKYKIATKTFNDSYKSIIISLLEEKKYINISGLKEEDMTSKRLFYRQK